MRKILLAVTLAVLTSCKKQEPAPVDVPVKAVAAGVEMIDYPEPSGAFQILGPAAWRVKEFDDLGPHVMLLGPGTSRYPRSVSISVSGYPNKVDLSPDPLKYYKLLELIDSNKVLEPFSKKTVGGREVEHYAIESPLRRLHERAIRYHKREDVAIIRVPGGFFRVSHVAPVETYKDTIPIFEAVVASFKPGPLPAAKAP